MLIEFEENIVNLLRRTQVHIHNMVCEERSKQTKNNMSQNIDYQAYENAVIGATPLPQLENLGESAENKDNMNWGNDVATGQGEGMDKRVQRNSS